MFSRLRKILVNMTNRHVLTNKACTVYKMMTTPKVFAVIHVWNMRSNLIFVNFNQIIYIVSILEKNQQYKIVF